MYKNEAQPSLTDKLWSLVCELGSQTAQQKQRIEELQEQAALLLEQAHHRQTGYTLRRFNVDVSQDVFDSELERHNVALVKENRGLMLENRELAALLREHESALEAIMGRMRAFVYASQTHDLNVVRTYENVLFALEDDEFADAPRTALQAGVAVDPVPRAAEPLVVNPIANLYTEAEHPATTADVHASLSRLARSLRVLWRLQHGEVDDAEKGSPTADADFNPNADTNAAATQQAAVAAPENFAFLHQLGDVLSEPAAVNVDDDWVESSDSDELASESPESPSSSPRLGGYIGKTANTDARHVADMTDALAANMNMGSRASPRPASSISEDPADASALSRKFAERSMLTDQRSAVPPAKYDDVLDKDILIESLDRQNAVLRDLLRVSEDIESPPRGELPPPGDAMPSTSDTETHAQPQVPERPQSTSSNTSPHTPPVEDSQTQDAREKYSTYLKTKKPGAQEGDAEPAPPTVEDEDSILRTMMETVVIIDDYRGQLPRTYDPNLAADHLHKLLHLPANDEAGEATQGAQPLEQVVSLVRSGLDIKSDEAMSRVVALLSSHLEHLVDPKLVRIFQRQADISLADTTSPEADDSDEDSDDSDDAGKEDKHLLHEGHDSKISIVDADKLHKMRSDAESRGRDRHESDDARGQETADGGINGGTSTNEGTNESTNESTNEGSNESTKEATNEAAHSGNPPHVLSRIINASAPTAAVSPVEYEPR